MSQLKSVKNAIEGAILKSKKLKESILKANWQGVVGELSKKSKLLYVKERTGYVLVESPAFLHHMNMSKQTYINNANRLLKLSYIDDFRFKVGHISVEEYFECSLERKNIEEVVELSSEEIKQIRESCNDIKDEEIKERIINLKTKSLKREKSLESNGYKKCQECGNFYLGEENICKICQNKKEKALEEKIIKRLNENLFLKFSEVEGYYEDLNYERFEKIKQIKLDKIYRKAKFLVERRDEYEAVRCLYDYFRLETHNSNIYELDQKSRNLVETIKKTFEKYKD